jgi:TetR/AcrR family transcriptional repressor of mexJK operon
MKLHSIIKADEGGRMAKRGRPTTAERAVRRDRILDAAVAAFAAQGFGATSLDVIAASAEVTKRTLYVDVGDKAALFAAAVEREHDRIRDVARSSGSLVEVCAEMVFVLHSESAVALHRSVIGEAQRFPELAEDFYRAGPTHSIELLARCLGAGEAAVPRASALYSLLLGEAHRRRLLGLAPAPSRRTAAEHARRALALLSL